MTTQIERSNINILSQTDGSGQNLDVIAATSAVLGLFIGISVFCLYHSDSPEVFLYIAVVSFFHFLEFYVTAKFNPDKVDSGSFLILNNGLIYIIVHLFSISEYFVEKAIFPNFKGFNSLRKFAIVLIIGGQSLRSLAMITAGRSFSHLIAEEHQEQHKLVTTGVYSVSRHPSYSGFFWWVVGTQLLLLNPISFLLACSATYYFFLTRIPCKYSQFESSEYVTNEIDEEKFLVVFFGKDYEEFRMRTGTLMPFIR